MGSGSGLYWESREGIVDAAGLERLICLLDEIDLGDATEVDRRLVSLLWFMPLFMEWQHQRVEDRGGDRLVLERATNRVHDSIERILGIP